MMRKPFASLVPVLTTSLFAWSTVGCAVLERADKNVGVETQEQEGGDSSDTGATPMTPMTPTAGMGGADSGTQGADLFNGSCPVEPCDAPGDGDQTGDGDLSGGDGDAPVGGLITNGDFSGGSVNWNGTNGTVDASSGAGCVTAEGVETPVLGWDSVTLESGASYTLSFDVVGDGALDLTAKVGGTTDPWPAYMEQELAAVSAGPQSIPFTMTEAATVGLAFILTTPAACIDNVTLVKN